MRVLFYLLFAGLAALPLTWAVLKTIRFTRGGPEIRRSMLQAARIKISWIRVARMLGLYIEDKSPRMPRTRRFLASFGQKDHRPDMLAQPRPIFPKLRVRADEYGVVVKAKTVPKVGLKEFIKEVDHLADAWQCTRVSVSQEKPGRLIVRAVRNDPLSYPTTFHPDGQPPTELDRVVIGVDEYAAPVPLRLSGVPGIGVYGLPGYGKTSLVYQLIAKFAPSPCVQQSVLDGKGDDDKVGADYEDLLPRFWFASGDNMKAANAHLHDLKKLRKRRAGSIRKVKGVKDIWSVGFSPDWPLTIVWIDEAHTYLNTTSRDGGNPELKERNALAQENAQLIEDLVKKGRSVGIMVVLLTQKGTGDAIPTSIRDVCPVSMAFACRTTDAAVAALGEDIREFPEANPIRLTDPAYKGVLTMVVEGRPGFTRVRTPLTNEISAVSICVDNAHLTCSPLDVLPHVQLDPVVEDDDTDELQATGTEG